MDEDEKLDFTDVIHERLKDMEAFRQQLELVDRSTTDLASLVAPERVPFGEEQPRGSEAVSSDDESSSVDPQTVSSTASGTRADLLPEVTHDLYDLVQSLREQVDIISAKVKETSLFFEFLGEQSAADVPRLSQQGLFGLLPDEILLHLLGFLDATDLGRVACVSRRFSILAEDQSLWKQHCIRAWGEAWISLSSVAMRPKYVHWKLVFLAKYRVFGSDAIKNGFGSYQLSSGSYYEGEWKSNERHGWGVSTMSNGRIYIGEYKNDKRTGLGTFSWPGGHTNAGDIFVGNWRNSCREGCGIYRWADGRVYEGEWKADQRDGRGVSTYPDGHYYEGEYRHGKRHGHGLCAYPDGSRYEGEYKRNKRDGLGKFSWPKGDVFQGSWYHGRRWGVGFVRHTIKDERVLKLRQAWREHGAFELYARGMDDEDAALLDVFADEIDGNDDDDPSVLVSQPGRSAVRGVAKLPMSSSIDDDVIILSRTFDSLQLEDELLSSLSSLSSGRGKSRQF